MVESSIAGSEATPDVGAAVRSADHVAWLRDVLGVIALESLGRSAWEAIEAPDRDPVVILVAGPVESATDAAIDRLAQDLAVVLELTAPKLLRHVHQDRHRAELGLD